MRKPREIINQLSPQDALAVLKALADKETTEYQQRTEALRTTLAHVLLSFFAHLSPAPADCQLD